MNKYGSALREKNTKKEIRDDRNDKKISREID